jgi:4-hydroxybenzoate polyprenyltransferase
MTSVQPPTPNAQREGQTFVHSGSKWLVYVNFVKLPHTLFALPFALVGVVLASYHAPVTWEGVGWVVLAFTCARFAAMGFNRIVDREIDARNPRTRQRELPSGALRVTEAVTAVAVASLLFVYAAWRLNPLCAMLSPVALAWVFFYSYTKRFTRWCHLVLGIGMSIAPVGGYLAVTGAWSRPWWMLLVLALAVATWGGGFDVLYALQDVEFDRSQRLYSLPSTLGERRALSLSRVLHVLTVASLALVGVATFHRVPGGSYYAVGVAVAAALLIYEHSLVKHDDFSRLDAAFFTMNGVISIVFFGCVLVDRLVSSAPALYAARHLIAR